MKLKLRLCTGAKKTIFAKFTLQITTKLMPYKLINIIDNMAN